MPHLFSSHLLLSLWSVHILQVAYRPVGLWIYLEYFGQSAGGFGLLVLVLFHLFFQVSYVASDIFLSRWTNQQGKVFGLRKEIIGSLGQNLTGDPAEVVHELIR